MSGGFLSGFAEGFVTERRRTIERQQDLDDQSFQYRMKYLTDQREKRDAKKVKETEWSRQAKDLAAQYGDPEAASSFYKELANGISYETQQKRIVEGSIQRNTNYVKPTQTVKVPSAVSMEPLDAQFPTNERVDKRIDSIDPTLRIAQPETDNEFSTLADTPDSQFVYKPANQMEVGDLDQAQYELMIAEQNKDEPAKASARLKIRAIELAETRKAQIKARAEGKSSRTYVMRDPKTGKVMSTFTGEIREDGNLWNTSNPQVDGNGNTGSIVTAEQMGQVVEISENATKEWIDLEKNFGKKSADLHEGSANFVGAMNSSKKILEILDRNPTVVSRAADAVEFARDLQGDVRAAYEIIVGKQTEIKTAMDNGDTDTARTLIAQYAGDVNDLIERAEQNSGLLSADNQKLASDKAIYDSLKTLLTFQMASANGVSGAKMSDKDFMLFEQIIGGRKRNADDVRMAISNAGQIVMTTLDAHREQINRDPSVRGFKMRNGFDPGIEVPRVGDLLVEMGREDLADTLGLISGKQEIDKATAAASAQQSSQEQGLQPGTIEDGFEYLGGDPSDQKNWKKVK